VILVISSNLGPVLLHFRDIAGFLIKTMTSPLFQPNLGDVPLGLDCRSLGCDERDAKLIICVITFKQTQPV